MAARPGGRLGLRLRPARTAATTRWWPQGISTSADASDTEDIGGKHVLAVSWYAKDESGVRVTFVDLASLRYRHVLLVVPVLDQHGMLVLRPLRVHAGGIVWNGPYLHVAATARGPDDLQGRRHHAGARRARHPRLPARARAASRWRRTAIATCCPSGSPTARTPTTAPTKLRYSFLSLDRSADPPALVAGEYGRTGQTTRLARYHLEPDTLMLQTGEDGLSRPIGLDEGGVSRMQGASIVDGRYHVTVSHGPWKPGSVYVGTPGDLVEHRLATPMGPEDIAYWPSTERFWSVSEHPHRRWVFSMKRSSFD